MEILAKGVQSVYNFEHLGRIFFPGAAVRRTPCTRGTLLYARAGARHLAVGLRHEGQLYVRRFPASANCAEISNYSLTIPNEDKNSASNEEKININHNNGMVLDKEHAQTILLRLLYNLLRESTGQRPPWGMLTGVRPLRLYRRYVMTGTPAQAGETLVQAYDVRRDKVSLLQTVAQNQVRILATQAFPDDIDEEQGGNILFNTHKSNKITSSGTSKANMPYSLYVSIPFCPSRCDYCSFVSQTIDKDKKLVVPYIERLDEELAQTAALAAELKLELRSVYVGGGTPTALPAAALERLLQSLQTHFAPRACPEYTVEAGRPDCTDAEKLQLLREYGVSRISINPQTMSDAVLGAIGRRHTAEDVCRCFEEARLLGHTNINMDLIAGLPSDSEAGFAQTLRQVLALAPESVTLHNLTMKRASNLVMGGATSAASPAAMLEHAYPRLSASGYLPYYLYRQKSRAESFENTGWAKPGAACLYNIYIMEEMHSILAVGAGASTKLVARGGHVIQRFFNPKYPAEYLREFEKVCQHKKGVTAFYASHMDSQASG